MSNKSLMEKRRRTRIKNSLSALKNLILDAVKSDNACFSKLGTADILEMTVKHLQNLQTQQVHPDPSMMAKFSAGYADCVAEVDGFMRQVDGIDQSIQQRLLNHLSNCLTDINNSPSSTLPHVRVSASTESELNSIRLLSGAHLVPTRLPSEDNVFLLPAQQSVYAPSTVLISPASSRSSVSSPVSMPSSLSPVNVLGFSSILSPASRDRSNPSPHYIHHEMPVQHCPVIVPAKSHHNMENKNIWRPF